MLHLTQAHSLNTIKRLVIITCMCVAATFIPSKSKGQGSGSPKNPSAVLVQLRAERNKINALTNAKRYKDLATLKRDVDSVTQTIIRDFNAHFKYCPVYYYIDTNFKAVMAKNFEGVLLNSDLTPAANIVLDNTSTDYLIVYYGEPKWQTEKNRANSNKKWDTTRAENVGGKPNGRALVINDTKMRQIYYIYRLDLFNLRKKKKKNPYKFESKKFDIEYYPCAAEFNDKLPYRLSEK